MSSERGSASTSFVSSALDWFSRRVRIVTEPVGWALMLLGGAGQDELEQATRAHQRALAARLSTFRAASDGPPAGHPERLCPEVPLTVAELMLMREVDHLDWSRGLES